MVQGRAYRGGLIRWQAPSFQMGLGIRLGFIGLLCNQSVRREIAEESSLETVFPVLLNQRSSIRPFNS